MATETHATGRAAGRARPARVVRYSRPTRWFHAVTYLVTFTLMFTGWWLLSGHEGKPSVLASTFDTSDVDLHRRAGWFLVVVGGLGITVGVRAALTFVRETVRVDRGDVRWFRHWLRGAATGRFARHEGHFDPGQRIMNVAFVATLLTLIVTGIGLVTAPAGNQFAMLDRIHRYATYVLIVLVAVHVFVALGVLPGYRGAWRSMHLDGRVSRRAATRLWPASTGSADDVEPSGRPHMRHRCSSSSQPGGGPGSVPGDEHRNASSTTARYRRRS
jgi:cytochrome b subunit of formate dehydrogenase